MVLSLFLLKRYTLFNCIVTPTRSGRRHSGGAERARGYRTGTRRELGIFKSTRSSGYTSQ
ncbi:hypothetical protein EI94DRAFT_1742881 [Lactarius quietus]|nr:hypothetical protein EI94DRAFT_1742881 [Lactarius quietus]